MRAFSTRLKETRREVASSKSKASSSSSSSSSSPSSPLALLFEGRGAVDICEADLGDYQLVANLLVDAFYTDTKRPENNLSVTQKRSLERDQNLDLRARYGRANRANTINLKSESKAKGGAGVIQSAILLADERDTGESIGCVAIGTTPFIGNDAQLNIRDLYQYSNRRDERACLRPVVANLAVRPQARRRGIAKRLMRECEMICKEWGYQEIWLLVEKDNPKARKLYKKLGYKTVKEEDDDTYKLVEGRIKQCEVKNVYMKKSLKPFVGPIENADYLQVVLICWALFGALANKDVQSFFQQELGLDISALADYARSFQ